MRAPFRQNIIKPNLVMDAHGQQVCDADSSPVAGRIVECLNALDGIIEPASMVKLWQSHIGAQHDSLGRAADALQAAKAERDAMLQVMRQARAWVGSYGTDRPFTIGDLKRIAADLDAAIERVPS